MKDDSDMLQVNMMGDDIRSYNPLSALQHFLTSGVGTRHIQGHNTPSVASHTTPQNSNDVEDLEIRVE